MLSELLIDEEIKGAIRTLPGWLFIYVQARAQHRERRVQHGFQVKYGSILRDVHTISVVNVTSDDVTEEGGH